jgi:adenylate cyclase
MNAELLARTRAALAAGDALIAYDTAVTAVAEEPQDLEAGFLVALSLARAGASDRATQRAESLLQAMANRADVAPSLREDIEALGARLLKDRALAATGQVRTRLATEAAARYEDTARRLGRYFSCVNAATLWLVAGDTGRSGELARLALVYADKDDDDDESAGRYWRAATRAEAALVLGDVQAARTALEEAALGDVGVAMRATTKRQLLLICSLTGADPALVDVLGIPTVIHYCGHRVDTAPRSRFPPGIADDVARRVAVVLDEYRCGIAYGSLACGADILIAEQLVDRRAELHVILPFDADEFEHESVRSGGPGWTTRFRSLLDAATSVTFAYDSSYLGDAELFTYASRLAMGRAIIRARSLGAEVRQLAVWDQQPALERAGTAHDTAVWRRAGHDTTVVALTGHKSRASPPTRTELKRAVRAVLFTDLRGFSRLRDEHYPALLEQVFTQLAASLNPYRGALLFHKTWGDGVQMVFTDVLAAGRAAIALQEVIASLDLESMGLPADLGLRIGGHVGPLLELRDPFGGDLGWWGREMTRTARIEPRTPEGEIYVTGAFASLLALEPDTDLVCEYVGRITTAKDFETIPMYQLVRTRQG